MDIFSHAAQIIVHARVARTPHEVSEEKNFRNLLLLERESVNLAFQRASATSQSPWRDMTVEIYYHAGQNQPVQLERWYLGFEGKPKIQKRQLTVLYRALYVNLRLAPIFRAKTNAIYPIVLSYRIIKGRPLTRLEGPCKTNTLFHETQPEGSLKLQTDHLTNLDEVLKNNPGIAATGTPPIAIPARRGSYSGDAMRLPAGSPKERRRSQSMGVATGKGLKDIARGVAGSRNNDPSPLSGGAQSYHSTTAPISIPRSQYSRFTTDRPSSLPRQDSSAPVDPLEHSSSQGRYYSRSGPHAASLPTAYTSPPTNTPSLSESILPFASPLSYQSFKHDSALDPGSFKGGDFLRTDNHQLLQPSPPIQQIEMGSELSLDSLAQSSFTKSPSMNSLSIAVDEELPFAMDEPEEEPAPSLSQGLSAPASDLDQFVQQCEAAPSLSMFKKQDVSQSMMTLDSDLRAVRDEYALFSQVVV